MGFKEDLEVADKQISESYERVVYETYTPIFKKIMAKAQKVMQDNGVEVLRLNTLEGLTFRNDGFYYRDRVKYEDDNLLSNLAKLYIKEDDIKAAQADARYHRSISIVEALNSAACDLVKKVQQAFIETF